MDRVLLFVGYRGAVNVAHMEAAVRDAGLPYLQDWLNAGWRFAPGFYAATTRNDCATVFLEREREQQPVEPEPLHQRSTT